MNIIIIIVICLPHLQLDNHRRGESLVQLDHHWRCLHPSRLKLGLTWRRSCGRGQVIGVNSMSPGGACQQFPLLLFPLETLSRSRLSSMPESYKLPKKTMKRGSCAFYTMTAITFVLFLTFTLDQCTASSISKVLRETLPKKQGIVFLLTKCWASDPPDFNVLK